MIATAYVDTFAADALPPPEQWPELLLDLPHLRYPERVNCVSELLDKAVAAGKGARAAMLTYDGVWTYGQLWEKVNRIANVLRDDLHLVPGNRVLLRGANTPMMAASILAVMKCGCIAVPSMPLLRSAELSAMIDKAQINAVLCDADLKAEMMLARDNSSHLRHVLFFNDDDGDSLESRMADKPAEHEALDTYATDICLISFTSGTTGKPKAAMHLHRDLLSICDCFPRSILRSKENDVFIGTPPLAFTFGLGGLLLFPLRAGAASVLLPKANSNVLLQAIADFRATICFTAPTFYRQMASSVSRHDISSLRSTVSAGEALSLSTRAYWRETTGLDMIDGIGSTEMLHIFISAGGDAIRPGAIGKPIPGYQACVLDDDGNPLPPGAVGHLAVKGPTGCRYLSDTRQKDYVHQGWNLTGDAFEMDADGYFWFRARTDDMIVSSGYNIAGPEVEDALLRHPAVAECGVIGEPDDERGQIVKAFVVLKPGHTGDAIMIGRLQDFVKETIAPYKYPRSIEFRASLPRTETGKLQRFRLRSEQ